MSFVHAQAGSGTDAVDEFTKLKESCAVTQNDKLALKAISLLASDKIKSLQLASNNARADQRTLVDLYAQLHALDATHPEHKEQWKAVTAKITVGRSFYFYFIIIIIY